MAGPRARELRQEYESSDRAAHYAQERWRRSRRARRSARREEHLVAGLLRACGPLDAALDVPCGTGRFRAVLEGAVASEGALISVDAALAMLREHPEGARLAASADALPLGDGTVDVVLCSRLLHHFEHSAERRAVLSELARVSRRWVIASYFDASCLQAWRNRVRGRFRGRFPVPAAVFESDAAAAGLRLRARRHLLRGVSEQVWVLLERGAR